MDKPTSVTSQSNEKQFCILINGLPHLVIDKAEVIGMQSWVDGYVFPKYFIEFYLSNGNDFVVEYHKVVLWKEVLKILKENL